MPAGILPFKRELNSFASVTPRYLDTIHREPQNYVAPPQERYDTQRQWGGVEPRYLTNVSSVEQHKLRQERQLSEKQALGESGKDPLGGWDQRNTHREYTKRHGLGGVASRYEEDAFTRGHPEVTPRSLVKKRDDIEKMERAWRGTHALNKFTTFDVLYKKRLKAHPEDDPANWKKNKARSPVIDYVRHGTPIESVSRNGVSRNDSNNNSHNGGARSSSAQVRRAQSPWQRTPNPEAFGDRPQWQSGGVASHSFSELQKRTMVANKHFRIGEEAAMKAMERQHSKKVEEDFIPRVAGLALVYQLPGYTPVSATPARAKSPNAGSASASSSPQRRPNSPQKTNGHRSVSPVTNTNASSRNNSPHKRSAAVGNNNKSNGVSYHQQQQKKSSTSRTSPAKQKSYNIGSDEKEKNRGLSSDEETEIGKN